MPRYRVITTIAEDAPSVGQTIAVVLEHLVEWGIDMTDLNQTSGVVTISLSDHLTSDQLDHLGLEVEA